MEHRQEQIEKPQATRREAGPWTTERSTGNTDCRAQGGAQAGVVAVPWDFPAKQGSLPPVSCLNRKSPDCGQNLEKAGGGEGAWGLGIPAEVGGDG